MHGGDIFEIVLAVDGLQLWFLALTGVVIRLTWAWTALQRCLSWTVECSKASLNCVITCTRGGFYCLFSVYALTFMRTEILYLENTVSPLNDCIYYSASSTEVDRKYTEICIPLSCFQAQASSVASMVLDRILFPSLCLPAICHAGTVTLLLKGRRFPTYFIHWE